jgi:subtilisin family serine protease
VHFLPPKKENWNTQIDPHCSLSAAAAGIANATIVAANTPGGFQAGDSLYGPGQGVAMGFSSLGPTRANLQRPDVSAPGDGIWGARSKGDPVGSKLGYPPAGRTQLSFGPADRAIMSGTSMAAPHVAGLIALYFDKIKRGTTPTYPTSDDMRKKLRQVARPAVSGGVARWDAQLGCGCVDATRLLK